MTADRRPNVVVVLADQWRASALGFSGDPNVHTPVLDRLAGESVSFTSAISPCPACTPARAALLTGRSAFSTGMFLNDARLDPALPSLGKVFSAGGYKAGWIGKWHVDGHGRTAPIPPERQHGFDGFWRALECTHDYHHSLYYADAELTPRVWPGYDAERQTECAIEFMRQRRDPQNPFALFLSWGPPHDPYHTAPVDEQRRYDEATLTLLPNVPADKAAETRKMLRGYYGHCSALDACVGRLWEALRELGLEENTLLVFVSDHGDLLGSHGLVGKQAPYEESIRVPLLMHWPAGWGRVPRRIADPIALYDLMPTLLELCGLPVPAGVEAVSWKDCLLGTAARAPRTHVLLHHLAVYGNWTRSLGAREYRGIRTADHTYVRDRTGEWLLFDLKRDPCQLNNLVDDVATAELRERLGAMLESALRAHGDPFAAGDYYRRRWGYDVDDGGNIVRFELAAGAHR